MRRWIPLSLGLLLACGGPRTVIVRADLPSVDTAEAPLAGLAFVALPYNRDSILAALTATGHPRPSTAHIDSLFLQFRAPFAGYVRASERVRVIEDSLRALPGGPDTTNPALVAARRARDSAQVRLANARAALNSPRAESLRAEITAWQDSTFGTYDSITKALTTRLGAQPVADTTGPTGQTTLTLPPDGSWWIYARSWDPLDPNAEWYWNLPVQGDTVRLNRRTGRQQPRY